MRALLVIDIQEGLTKKKNLLHCSLFIETVNSAINRFRELKNPVIFIQHNNKHLISGTADWEIDNRIVKKDDDIVIQKQQGNAFKTTNLKSVIKSKNIKEVIICGLVSHGCVRATCIGGINTGLSVGLLADGHTNWNEDAAAKITSTELELEELGVKKIFLNEL